MNIPVKLYLNVEDKKSLPQISIKFNNNIVIPSVDLTNIDKRGNVFIFFDVFPEIKNTFEITVKNNNKKIEIIEAIADDIHLAYALFLSTKDINNIQTTSLVGNGSLFLSIDTPVWKWWCDTMSSYNPKNENT